MPAEAGPGAPPDGAAMARGRGRPLPRGTPPAAARAARPQRDPAGRGAGDPVLADQDRAPGEKGGVLPPRLPRGKSDAGPPPPPPGEKGGPQPPTNPARQ